MACKGCKDCQEKKKAEKKVRVKPAPKKGKGKK
jgi:hypothetical protein